MCGVGVRVAPRHQHAQAAEQVHVPELGGQAALAGERGVGVDLARRPRPRRRARAGSSCASGGPAARSCGCRRPRRAAAARSTSRGARPTFSGSHSDQWRAIERRAERGGVAGPPRERRGPRSLSATSRLAIGREAQLDRQPGEQPRAQHVVAASPSAASASSSRPTVSSSTTPPAICAKPSAAFASPRAEPSARARGRRPRGSSARARRVSAGLDLRLAEGHQQLVAARAVARRAARAPTAPPRSGARPPRRRARPSAWRAARSA